MLGRVRVAFAEFWKIFTEKSSESGRKSLENGEKHRYQFVYKINKIILDFNSISS